MFLDFDPIKNTYHTIAKNLKYISTEFQDTLPLKLKKRCFRFKYKNKLAKSFMENNTAFHKDCVAKYNKSKLAQKRKLFEKEHVTEQGRTEAIENLERFETQRKLTWSIISLKNFTPACFFCDKYDRVMKLHLCQTFKVQQKIEEIAQEIGDTKVLAKLSGGDMISIEAKYHCKCLAAYYNKKEK